MDKMIENKLKAVLRSMIYRCNNKDDKYYGGKGIKVYEEWKDNPELFVDWAIDNGYEEGLSIDRIDGNGNYEPNNCRWVDMKSQNNNRSNNSYIIIDGMKLTYSQCEEYTSISQKLISNRVRRGKKGKDILCNKIENGKFISYNGMRMNISQWGEYTGLGREVIKKRLSSNWSIQDTLTTPLKATEEKRAKISKDDVVNIRYYHSENRYNVKELSEIYNITPKSVRNIIQYKTWKNI